MLHVCVLSILSHTDRHFKLRFTHLFNHWSLAQQHTVTTIHKQMCTWERAALLSEPTRSLSGSVNTEHYVILQFVSRRVTAPNISLRLALVLRNPWKKSVRGMSSPRLQHTTGGGLNTSGASKPVLFTNKMQL